MHVNTCAPNVVTLEENPASPIKKEGEKSKIFFF